MLIARIDDDAVPDADLEAYFDFEVERMPAGLEREPQVAAGDDIINLSTALEGILGAFNRRANRRRLQLFARRSKGFTGTTIVADRGRFTRRSTSSFVSLERVSVEARFGVGKQPIIEASSRAGVPASRP